jgi:hypothetical protein
VGAVRRVGGGFDEEKPFMVHKVICSSLSALERIKSL